MITDTDKLYERAEIMLDAVEALNLPSSMSIREQTLPNTGETVYYIYVVREDGSQVMIASVFDIPTLGQVDFEGLAKVFSFSPTWISFLVAKLFEALDSVPIEDSVEHPENEEENSVVDTTAENKLRLASLLVRDLYRKAQEEPEKYALKEWLSVINLLVDTNALGLWNALEDNVK